MLQILIITLKEAFRVLKPGGRFMCLEFSKIDNEFINTSVSKDTQKYTNLGKILVGSSRP